MEKVSGKITVRMATVQDEDAIFFMLLDMAKENSKHPVSVSKSIATIQEVTAIGGGAVAELDGEIIGSVGVSLQSPWYSNAQFLGDSWFYVKPENRRSRAAILLKKAAHEFADNVGLDLVLAVFSIHDADRKSKFFARGMKHLGGAYVYEVKKD